ncbi:bifunctional precorrin-2 dehydrogenase/sirohydrochlorin ferrochelatase [Acidocella sp.]|uniref:precorrin-2 dehydrogenase/sirohydrochlorin ferrochelatase family protein n=1 Tax=Acidocella sp. TaxID=50710 RepID=UPI002624ABC4|nr:NAD(P)-dependent oxidoreductase [Acidocella sp.]MDD2794804.1 NAD(P)-dependent oxidoreductase [Acidocella sp.]
MIPLAIDPKHLQLAVAGNGALTLRRLLALRRAGAEAVLVFADAPTPALAAAAGAFLRPCLPDDDALAKLHLLWISDLPEPLATGLAQAARTARVLVNVEDVPSGCDFHSVAEVRRGDLLITVSTNGAAPGLARGVRRGLEACFGPEWGARVEEIAALRHRWRAEGLSMPEISQRIETLLTERCWLSCPTPR